MLCSRCVDTGSDLIILLIDFSSCNTFQVIKCISLCRACRGKHITLYIRFSPQARQSEDFEIWSHTNESLASVRRHIYSRYMLLNSRFSTLLNIFYIAFYSIQ